MASSVFHFKKFSVQLEGAAHPVGTDSILLGVWTRPILQGAILDIGTGTGVCALMMAQKTHINEIVAIDLDAGSVVCATQNFQTSPWSNRLCAQHSRFQDFVLKENSKQFSTIICNPPFFKEAISAQGLRRSNARHIAALPFLDLIQGVEKLLSDSGHFSVILPYSTGQEFKELAAQNGLYFSKETNVRTLAGKDFERSLLEFSKKADFQYRKELVLMERHKMYSDAYWELSKDFYLKQKMGSL